jgi:hypothetical protein
MRNQERHLWEFSGFQPKSSVFFVDLKMACSDQSSRTLYAPLIEPSASGLCPGVSTLIPSLLPP